MAVRVRFAPSPTGPLHIGGVRTALYNYLFARKHGGDFILRIEDTDQQRYVEGAEEYILEALRWFRLTPDEGPGYNGAYGPYRQSERRAIYAEHARMLLTTGKAYYAFDTPGELEEMRLRHSERGVHSPRYDHNTRGEMRNSLSLGADEVHRLLESGAPYTLRLRVDPGEEVSFDDSIRGRVSFDSGELDDKVLMKSDGLPTYHLANVVDDYLMKITHVIRGEEWLSSTPHHVLLYRAFGWEDHMPAMAHLPLLLKPNGKGKLSKRDGAEFGFPVFPLDWTSGEDRFSGFREAGFEAAAVINFLALLGWNPGTEQERFTMEELIEAFSLDHIVKSGARFDFDKALWFNQQYLIDCPNELIAKSIKAAAEDRGWRADLAFLTGVARLMKERVHRAPEILEKGSYLFTEPTEVDLDTAAKKWSDDFAFHVKSLLALVAGSASFHAPDLSESVKAWIAEKGLKMGQVLPILRLGLTGTMQGPDVFETFELLGKETCLERLSKAFERFASLKK